MSIAMKKLALLEQNLIKQEEAAKIQGNITSPVDTEFRRVITSLVDKVRNF